MKKTPLYLTLGSILLVVLGYFGYKQFFDVRKYTLWDFVPDQTVLVYETGDCEECIESIKKSPLWDIYESVLNSKTQEDSLRKILDFLDAPKPGQLVSLHVTRKDDFDFIYYLPQRQVTIEEGSGVLKNAARNALTQRELDGLQIHELRINKSVFSWTVLEGYWIGSFTPFLVEDVIRTYTSEERSEFLTQISGVSQLSKIKNDAGNIYVNYERVFDWLSVFLERRPPDFKNFGQSSLLDIKQSEGSVVANGFSAGGQSGTFLARYSDQTPVPLTVKQYISDRTLAAVVHGISDGGKFYEKLSISRNKGDLDSLSRLSGMDVPALYNALGKELAACYLEGRMNSLAKIIAFNSTDSKSWLGFFSKLSDALEKDDTVFYERYSTYEIREVELANLPGKLFAPLASGFSTTYYTSIGTTVFLSGDLEELKYFLDDIDNEEVWGKSILFNKFTESTLLESNYSIFVNTPRVWSSLEKDLSPKWQKFITDNRDLIAELDYGAIQFSHLNESFYTNLIWTYHEGRSSGTTAVEVPTERIVANLSNSILSGPFIIRNHASKQDEIIVQDSTYRVYQLDPNGKTVWSTALAGPILGGVHQIDYFRNSKLQLFFATDGVLHVIDRLGRYVEPFPVRIQPTEIDYTSVVDYDKSRNYRFLVADKKGKLWLYDKGGSNLEGWKPKAVEGVLSAASNHHRVRGKDFFIGIRRDGVAFVMNRRAENSKGFPLDLDSRPDGDYILETGNTLATTYFVVISRDGFRVKFNLEGKIINKETLVKPTIETQFSMVKELSGKGYLIKRQDIRHLSLLNSALEEIVRNDYVGTSPSNVQYYDFGSGRLYIVIQDLAQNLFYLYDGRGNLLTRTPLSGKGIQLRLDETGSPVIYLAVDNQVIIQPL